MTSARFRTSIILVVLCISAAHALQGESDLTLGAAVEKHEGIDAVYRQFSKAYRDLDVQMVEGLYAEQALYMPPGNAIRKGREAIGAIFNEFFESVRKEGRSVSISFDIVERQVSGDLAYDVGIYTLRSHLRDGTRRASKGKFVVITRRQQDGVWRFQVDAYSDLKP